MAARGDITQYANPKFLWGTPQTLSYNPTKFQPICSAGPFSAKIPILTAHPIPGYSLQAVSQHVLEYSKNGIK